MARLAAAAAAAVLSLLAGAVLAGCGGSGTGGGETSGALPSSGELRAQLRRATASTAADFPAARGRTLRRIAGDIDGTGPEVGLATQTLTAGDERLAFGVIDSESGFVYGKTAVYIAAGPGSRARGPYPAPADLLTTDPPYRSKTAATEKDPFAAIYEGRVPLRSAGRKALLVVTRLTDGRLIGAGATIKVRPRARDQVARVGEPAPRVHTDTVESADGDIASIDTRVPPDDMHDVDLADVAGRKPVALLFATPQLCQSRVCGPVVDIAAQLKRAYGERMAFIHQEVYEGNDPKRGLREPLRRFGLQTEPWLFVIDRHGRVAARLEGSFGFEAFKRAIESGLE